MKNIRVMALLCLVSIVILPSCEKIVGKGPVVSENRTVAPFHAMAVNVPANAYFSQSSVYSVELRAQQNILDEIETVIVNDELKIRFKDPGTSIRSHEEIALYVSAPSIQSLEVNGSGNLNISPLSTSSMRLFISGSGSIRAESIEASTLTASVSGSGYMKVTTGSANDEDVSISGSGNIDLAGVFVKNADARISGSAVIKVNVKDVLDARISGSGTIMYYGTPVVHSSISGSGSLVKL